MADTDSAVGVGLLVYFLAPLVAIFIGPLEAIAGIVGYWLIRPDGKSTTGSDRNTT